ncbi:MAG TPA: disulfide bond formation protein B [Ignavibacteria bacterium]|nr:disulfide bond formation protein B [Ignavibacteria bacterium]
MNMHPVAKTINIIGILGLGLVIIGAYTVQFVLNELPCPLCLLQRVGMLMVMTGFAMNLKFGIRPAHYGMSIIGALFGASVSMRQILLHIVPVPGQPTGYGTPILGMHLYTWAFIFFMITIFIIAVVILFGKQFETSSDSLTDKSTEPSGSKLEGFAMFAFYVVFILAAANVVTSFLECGLGPCPDNPVNYMY